MKFNPGAKLNELDKQIIRLISKDAMPSASQIGAKLGANYKTIQNNTKQNKESGGEENHPRLSSPDPSANAWL